MPAKKQTALSKINLAVICGGQSVEHLISIMSAKNVVKALDAAKYQVKLIYISREGQWYWFSQPRDFLASEEPWRLLKSTNCHALGVALGQGRRSFFLQEDTKKKLAIDVAFPVLHGLWGEDGTVQGMLELARIPFVGAGVLGSAICMDKVVTKKLLNHAGILTSRWLTFRRHECEQFSFQKIKKTLGLPFFVKPANTGSSLGVSKVKQAGDFVQALEAAFKIDDKLIVEATIQGREIECAVLGNEQPQASGIGEIITNPKHDFYTYQAKYFDPEGAALQIPARLPAALAKKIRETAVRAYQALECRGMARVDFFLTAAGDILVNELNTLPGFTNISMYPSLWIEAGLSYSKLLDQLIALALKQEPALNGKLKADKSTAKKSSKSAYSMQSQSVAEVVVS